jgi:putative chitinase
MIIQQTDITGILPHAKLADIQKYLPFLQKYMPLYGIDTPQRAGAFIAQIGEESINLSAVREDISDADAEKEYGVPTQAAKNLGNVNPGDGAHFKGHGLIQITGRAMTLGCSTALFKDHRLLNTPEVLEQPEWAVASACWFWKDVKGLNFICDQPEQWTKFSQHFNKTYTKIEWITILINGGLNGIAVRTANYTAARQVLKF